MAEVSSTPEELAGQLEQSLLSLDRIAVQELLNAARDGLTAIQRIDQLVIPALERIGEKWATGEVSLAQVYMSGRICEELVDLILPPVDPARRNYPPIAIAVLEDYHLLGKRIVYSALRASVYELLNYPHL
jgi:methanogenic corrinoid protein MtbC1